MVFNIILIIFTKMIQIPYNDNQYDNNHGHHVIPISCLQYRGETKCKFRV